MYIKIWFKLSLKDKKNFISTNIYFTPLYIYIYFYHHFNIQKMYCLLLHRSSTVEYAQYKICY